MDKKKNNLVSNNSRPAGGNDLSYMDNFVKEFEENFETREEKKMRENLSLPKKMIR